MNTIFRKVSSDKYPEKDDFYFVAVVNEQDLILCHFNKETKEWHDGGTTYLTVDIHYWLLEEFRGDMSRADRDLYWKMHDVIYNSIPAGEPEVTDLCFQETVDKVFKVVKGYDFKHSVK